MLRNSSEDPLSTDRECAIQLLEASSVRRDEIVDNHRGDLRQPRYHVEKEELPHSAKKRRGDVLTTSLCTTAQRRRYVSSKTPSDVSMEHR